MKTDAESGLLTKRVSRFFASIIKIIIQKGDIFNANKKNIK